MTPKIVSIVGKSNSGKTTLLEKIVRTLAKKGYRIGTIKHGAEGFEIDYPGKDSYRHFHAGSSFSMILSPDKIAVVKRLGKPLSLHQAVRMFCDDKYGRIDLVIAEGFKKGSQPKIEIVRKNVFRKPIYPSNTIALVTDNKIKHCNIPQFGINAISEIINFIEEKIICRRKIKK
jgi:molybdopterin-guanine dinucleotide biosynthesis adapter protein